MGSFSIWHWLIVLLVVVLIFGTKKLKNIGSDLGGAVKGFKDGVKSGGTDAPAALEVLKRIDREPGSYCCCCLAHVALNGAPVNAACSPSAPARARSWRAISIS